MDYGWRPRPVGYRRGVSGNQVCWQVPTHYDRIVLGDSNWRMAVKPCIVRPLHNTAIASIPGGNIYAGYEELFEAARKGIISLKGVSKFLFYFRTLKFWEILVYGSKIKLRFGFSKKKLS